jgi:two-component system, LuxR family, response regulator FixJ
MRLSPLELSVLEELRSKPVRLGPLERNLIDAIAAITREQLELSDRASLLGLGVPDFDSLTDRENEVLKLVVEGETNKSAADRLGISPRTVELHRGRIIKKFHAKSTMELIRMVMEGLANGSPATDA